MAKLGQEIGIGVGELDEILNSDSDDDKVPDPFKDVAKIENGAELVPIDLGVTNLPEKRLETTSGTAQIVKTGTQEDEEFVTAHS